MPKSVVVTSLSQENLRAYSNGGGRYLWPICSELELQLEINIPDNELTLHGKWDGSLLDVTDMANCTFAFNASESDALKTFRLSLNNVSDWYLFYQFIELIVRNMSNGALLANGYSAAVDEWRSLLAARTRLSTEREIGLFGELLFVESLLKTFGRSFDISCWTGPKSEEHDFKFANRDLEVKTTTSESRSHRITSLTQLEPSPNKELYLLSIQITRDGSIASTLPELVDRVRALLQVKDHEKFADLLCKSQFHEDARDLLTTKWGLRSSPNTYLVDETFPSLTDRNISMSPSLRSLVSDIEYRVNVSTLSPLFNDFQTCTESVNK
jgi:hypothetical protein